MSSASLTASGLADPPGSAPRAERSVAAFAPVLSAGAVAAVLAVVVLLSPPTGTDLAAQVARADFWSGFGAATYDLRWYGGVHPGAYSVLAPPLMATIGVRLAGALAAVAGAMALAALLVRAGAPRPRFGAAWGAVALVANLVSGRVTFGLGTAVGLAALLALPRRFPAATSRVLAAGLLAAVTTLLSPVAGLFVGLAGLALAGTGRRREGAALVIGAAVPLLAVQAAFPDGGLMPFAWRVAWPAMLAGLVVALLVPRSGRAVRLGALLYAAGVLAAFLLPTALGSNAERLGLLFAGPVLAATARWPRLVLVPVLALTAYWQAMPARTDLRYADDPASHSSYSAGLVAELHRVHAETGRVEIVPQRNHWESATVAREFPLARGWERQVDLARNPLFYAGRLSPAAYRSWLADRAVGYVALADVRLDWAAPAEAALLDAGQPWLEPVWNDAHWRLWRVRDATPLVAAPARVTAAGADSLSIDVPTAGSVRVLVRWSPWLTVREAAGCLRRDGSWVRLETRAPGVYRIGAGSRPHLGGGCR
jgi:hypothetical protein